MSLKSKIVMGLSLAAPLILVSPSKAAPLCSDQGSSFSIANLVSLGATGCQDGDKVFSNFNFTGTWGTGSAFTITNTGNQHTFSGSGLALNPGSYGYSYSVAIAAGYPQQRFLAYRTGAGTSDIFNPLTSSKTLTGVPNNGTVTAIDDGTSSNYIYNPSVSGPIAMSSSITVTGGRMDIISDSYAQETVPGPLPLLGAGAAFGFSRKLRLRVRSSV
jgi:hypothetical protein